MSKPNDDIEIHVPEFLRPLFWEYNVRQMDVRKHADAIMDRIMERGTWDAMCWLRKVYDSDQIVSYLKRRGMRVLPPREMNYWALVSGVPQDQRTAWMQEARKPLNVWKDRFTP
ncbi:MAG: hypothetical protein A2Z25_11810 [Planctomycetes bacterium RBG_16_55_9]|nr:MAG: hypothetical protein A2Z25_11810 [Planctomycetes bacterium RBG_16_55_9]